MFAVQSKSPFQASVVFALGTRPLLPVTLCAHQVSGVTGAGGRLRACGLFVEKERVPFIGQTADLHGRSLDHSHPYRLLSIWHCQLSIYIGKYILYCLLFNY